MASFVKDHWKEIALAAAVVFTAGAALGYVGMGAGGGLTFGANVGVGGLSGVGTAFGALGNTVMGAVGLGTPFGGTVTAKSASVMGLGTGGMSTASGMTMAAGETAKFAGGGLLTPGSVQMASVTSPTAAQAGATAVQAGTAAPTAYPANAAANAATAGAQAGPPAALAGNPTVAANAAGGFSGGAAGTEAAKAGMTLGEKMMMGSMAMQGAGAYLSADAQEEAQKEALEAQRRQWDWNYDDYTQYLGNSPAPVPMYGARPPTSAPSTGRPLLSAERVQTIVPRVDLARARYNV